ncbi:MAG: NADH-quinone oxidoreductase subunit J family protein [Acidimicrobiales bacterium]
MTDFLLVAGRATVPDLVTYVICAAVVVSGGLGVVTSRNAVHAALSLVMTLFGVAVLFIEQDAQFLAAVQVIVYAGAIVVLFLFVIMFLGVDRQESLASEPLKGQRPLALLLIAVAATGVIFLAATSHWVTGARAVAGSTTAGGHTNTYLLGKSVFTTYLWAFEITAGLLVIAVVGAVVLARRPSGVHDEPRDAPAVGPDGSGPGGRDEEALGLEATQELGGQRDQVLAVPEGEADEMGERVGTGGEATP